MYIIAERIDNLNNLEKPQRSFPGVLEGKCESACNIVNSPPARL